MAMAATASTMAAMLAPVSGSRPPPAAAAAAASCPCPAAALAPGLATWEFFCPAPALEFEGLALWAL